MCHICIHSYKCTCLNNVINYNICKHIHACAAASEPNQVLNFESKVPIITPVSNPLVIDRGLINITNNTDVNNSQIKNKIEMILGMCNRTNLNDEDQNNVLKHCDKILDIFAIFFQIPFSNHLCSLQMKTPKLRHIF
uniref:SWIM-type domain-containing protein n=1 Tax=Schizaphis graminum TaxID=13262 RepID=A0A2S2NYX7_SCHGA